jgi:hypothetical protein
VRLDEVPGQICLVHFVAWYVASTCRIAPYPLPLRMGSSDLQDSSRLLETRTAPFGTVRAITIYHIEKH